MTESETGTVDTKRRKVELPEGMSKNAWKKLQKQKKWDEQKEEYRQRRREKNKVARANKKLRREESGAAEENYHLQLKRKKPQTQVPSGISVIMDCGFDQLMSDKEIVSLSNQITRCYSAKRHSMHEVPLVISSFKKRLKARFEKLILDYKLWQNICFKENDTLEELLPKDEAALSKYIYLTADTDTELDKLEEGYTYILGGIVDKNRHKQLCLKKAQNFGLKVARLPIGKYIQMNGRQVLATSHVYEMMCMYFETGHNWGQAFNAVLPPRKLKAGKEKGETNDRREEGEGHEGHEVGQGEGTLLEQPENGKAKTTGGEQTEQQNELQTVEIEPIDPAHNENTSADA